MLFTKKRIYMDYASTTPLSPRVLDVYTKALRVYGNASSVHEEGRVAHALLEEARRIIARTLSVRPETLVFTGSGTEGNNLALEGFVRTLHERGMQFSEMHIIVSAFEHSSIVKPIAWIEKQGVAISYVTPTADGMVRAEDVLALVRKETVLISVCAVQGEIGTIQPLKEIRTVIEPIRESRGQGAHSYAPEIAFPVLHTDASQGPLFLDVSPERLGVDMATYDAQKIRGPKGVGVLYRHSSISLNPVIQGGRQERGVRAGTENVPAIRAMAEAFRIAEEGRSVRVKKVSLVRDYFIELLKKEIPDVEINGSLKKRVANNVNISLKGVDGDYLTVLMDTEGIAMSPRSACIAAGEPSATIAALGKTSESAAGTARFSFSPDVTRTEAQRAIRALKKVVTLATRTDS